MYFRKKNKKLKNMYIVTLKTVTDIDITGIYKVRKESASHIILKISF